jgi:hypothetical protein
MDTGQASILEPVVNLLLRQADHHSNRQGVKRGGSCHFLSLLTKKSAQNDFDSIHKA